jgi:hypothetical protein
MKIWKVDGRDVVLKRDTNRFDPSKLEAKSDAVASMYAKLQTALEIEWRDNISFWDRNDLCTSPRVEDWRCGSFGPEGRVCKRLEGHAGRCSDFFSPADTKALIKMEATRRREELGEILGRPLASTSSQKYDLRKLREILKAEKQQ